MGNMMSKLNLYLPAILWSLSSFFYMMTTHAVAETTNDVAISIPFNSGVAEKKLIAPHIEKFISPNITANFFYNGKLVDQVFSGLGVISNKIKVDKNIYLVTGWRYKDADNRTAVIVTKDGRVLLVALRTIIFSIEDSTRMKEKPLVTILFLKRENLKYDFVLKKLFHNRKYEFRYYDLGKCNRYSRVISIDLCESHR